MKPAFPLEQDDPVYGDYPALYALGIVAPVKAASLRRARGFTFIALLGVSAIAVVAVVAGWWV
jgi:hypothetical protein